MQSPPDQNPSSGETPDDSTPSSRGTRDDGAASTDPLSSRPPGPRPRTVRLKRQFRAAVALLLVCMGGLLGAAFMVYGYGESSYRWRGMDVRVRLVPSLKGETRFVFAPLGEVRAKTHGTPVALSISLNGISFEELRRFVQSPPKRAELEEEFRRASRRALNDFAVRQILLGAAGGLLAPLLLRLKRARFYTVPAIAGASFVAFVFFHAAGSFNPRALASPSYTGSLREANWIIGLVKDGFIKAEVLSERLKRVAGNLTTLYGRIESIPGVRNRETIKVLHISDIHNNAAAADFVRELAERMEVDLVIDTGDLTDLGLPIETSLTRALGQLKVPYLFAAGNHDSQATINALRKNRNAIILHDAPVTVGGLTIVGGPDPSSSRTGQGSVDTSESSLQSAAAILLNAYQSTSPPPDIVAVHNPKQAGSLTGIAKLVLCGHMHRASLETVGPTVICNAGTTGGAGVRYFEKREGVPFTAMILFFSRPVGTPLAASQNAAPRDAASGLPTVEGGQSAMDRPRLLYIDRVTLSGDLGEYSLTRKSFEPFEEPVGILQEP